MATKLGLRRVSLCSLTCLSVLGVAGLAQAQPFRGSSALEPGLANRDDILLFEDFEQDNWQSHWTYVPDVGFVEANTKQVFQGQRALEVTVPTGQQYGTSMEFKFSELGLAEPEELYFRYYVWFTDSYGIPEHGNLGKLPGFGGTYDTAGWGGRSADGTNGWSARMHIWDNRDTVVVGFGVYHVDAESSTGDDWPWEPYVPRNQWVCIEAHVKLNTLGASKGNNDGELTGWIDENEAFRRTNLRFRDVDRLKIEKIWFDVFVGGDFTAAWDMTMFYDNVVVARNRIGCYGGGERPPDDLNGTGGGGASIPASGTGGTRTSRETGGRSSRDAQAGDDDAETRDAGALASSAAGGGDEGCGCAVPGQRGAGSWFAVAGLAAALSVFRRRTARAS